MSRPHLHPLALALALALASPAHALVGSNDPEWVLCRAPDGLGAQRPSPATVGRQARAGAEIDVRADQLNVSGEKVTVFKGNVELTRADQWLGTDELTYTHESETWASTGPVRFEDEGLRLTAAKASGDNAKEQVSLTDVRYQLSTSTLGNGEANSAVREGARSTLTDASFSTCPPGQRQWAFEAATIEIDDEKKTGTAQNATLRIGGVPVLWLPYVSFPTTDERRSGVLAPTLGYNERNGIDVQLPYYLNLAPNYDATLYPRVLGQRGFMMGAEFRYLTDRSSGIVEGTYLPDDDVAGRDRGLFRWQNTSGLTPHWYAAVNLQNVSDRGYLRDFGTDFGQTSLSLLDSNASLIGRGRYWTSSLSVERWQAANPAVLPGSEPFSRLPRLRGTWMQPLQPWLEAGVAAEAVHFTHDERAGGKRFDVRPSVRLPFGGSSWFITPELGWRYTQYQLERDPLVARLDRNPSRSLPFGSLDMGLFFERETRIGGTDLVQTLEPRLYYLRVPYRDQSNLPLFDTQPLSFSWPGLFRDNRYTGADRQADANQATFAVTTRLLGAADGRERLSASVGRVHYFDPPRVTLPGERVGGTDGSAYVGELDLRVSDAWSVSLAQQWNPGALGTDLSAVRTQYRFSERGLINASYRYRKDLLEQTDFSFAAPINQNWRAVGRWAWSVREGRTLEALGGLEWRSCCVAVRVLARDYVRDINDDRNLGIYLEIELNGIGRFGRDSERLLSDAILGYSP